MHLGKNKILITGADGFLGYEILKFLSEKKNVIGTSKNKNKKFIQVNYPKNSINEEDLNDVNTVIHLASLDREQVKKNIKFAKKINIQFTEDLINKCIKKKVRNFIYFSSISVYGKNLKNKVDEKTKPLPIDQYSKLKYLTEKKILKKKNIRIIILRLSNIIGKPSRKSKGFLKLFLPTICNLAIRKKIITLKYDGNQYRDFLSLENLLQIIYKIIANVDKLKKRDIFNVSLGKSIKVKEISEKVKNIVKKIYNKNIIIIKGKSSKEKKYVIANHKLKKQLQCNISYNLNKTIKNVIKFIELDENRTS